jgi:hydrogen peroxide-dependent heme synthase
MDEVVSHAELEPCAPCVGWAVLHLFGKVIPASDGEALLAVLEGAGGDGVQVVTVAMLGHRADIGIMALAPDVARLRRLQTAVQLANVVPSYSYVSLTEVSEYAAGISEEMREARLHPLLPPEGKPAYCFYPMSKRRGEADNWYRLDYDARLALMHGHGEVGKEFRGRVLQLITGSTGLDDFEWGVSLFAEHPDDLKDCVYRMRFDEASARFAEFGPFLTGVVGTPRQVLTSVGLLGPEASPPLRPEEE